MHTKRRIVAIDILRILAAFGVIYNHSDLFKYYLFTNNELVRFVSIGLSYWCAISVTLFFMLSGALLLGKEEKYETYLKRIAKTAMIIIMASIMQYFYKITVKHVDYSIIAFAKDVYKEYVVGSYWFLYSYLSFIIILPFVRKISLAMRKADYYYLFALYIVFEILIELFEMFFASHINIQALILKDAFLFPLAGRWVYENYKKINKILFASFGLSGVLLTFVRQYIYYSLNGIYSESLIGEFSLLLAISIMGLVLKTDTERINEKTAKLINICGEAMMGVYLISNIVKEEMLPLLEYAYHYSHKWISCCIFIVVEFLLCTIISVILFRGINYIRLKKKSYCDTLTSDK